MPSLSSLEPYLVHEQQRARLQMTSTTLLTLELAREHDIVLVRRRARQIAAEFGLEGQEQTRLATAVSEITRNAFQYAGGGRVEFSIEHGPPAILIARIIDRGPGIPRLRDILEGRYVSPTGLGVGMVGARRLTDRFEVETESGKGTSVILGKRLPEHVLVNRTLISSVAASIAANTGLDDKTELQQQNQELLRALSELREKQTQNERLAQELAETNSGVLALYAELDERAGYLERLNELKTHFLSDLNHEIRTPLNAVRNIARLLLDGYEGELTERQRKAVEMMRSSTDSLSDLVNDWLDLAKIEAGKVDVRIEQFEVEELFGALRALFRPIAADSTAPLIFEPLPNLPSLVSDHGKVAQVMRNLISNALKFTEEGEVRVNAAMGPADTIIFTVCDTGIGIAPDDMERIFEEFAQVENPIQRRVKGTGLGLPLSRRLARLVGGEITVRSEVGAGSTFALMMPVFYGGALTMAPTADEVENEAVRSSAGGTSRA